MMDQKVREVLLDMIRGEIPEQTIVARVEGVDLSRGTCDVVAVDHDDYVLFDVRLRASISNDTKGILIVPVVGSYVLVSIIKSTPQSGHVSCFTEVEKIVWYNDSGKTLELSETLKLNGDQYGGLVIIQSLVDKINALEDALNQHVHTGVTTGTGSTGIPTPIPIIQKTKKQDLENTDVNHG